MKIPWLSASRDDLPPMRRGVDVYFDEAQFLVCSDHSSTTRMNGPGNPHEFVSREVSAVALGRIVLTCLVKSRTGLSKEELAEENRSVLRSAKVASLNKLSSKWSYIMIEENGDVVSVRPMRRSSRGGYISFQGDPVYACELKEGSVGQCVLEAAGKMETGLVEDDEGPSHV